MTACPQCGTANCVHPIRVDTCVLGCVQGHPKCSMLDVQRHLRDHFNVPEPVARRAIHRLLQTGAIQTLGPRGRNAGYRLAVNATKGAA